MKILGLDVKSLIVGVVIAMFVWPWISAKLNAVKAK